MYRYRHQKGIKHILGQWEDNILYKERENASIPLLTCNYQLHEERDIEIRETLIVVYREFVGDINVTLKFFLN